MHLNALLNLIIIMYIASAWIMKAKHINEIYLSLISSGTKSYHNACLFDDADDDVHSLTYSSPSWMEETQ